MKLLYSFSRTRPRVPSLALLSWLAAASSLSFSSASSSTSPVVSSGLMNLGNTCYANAQFQCAFHIPLVRTLIECPPNVKKQKKKKAVSTARTAVSEEKEKDAEQRRQDEEGNPQEGPTEDGDGKDSISDNEQVKVEEEEEEPESVAIQALRQVFQEMETSISAVSPRRFCQVLGIPVMEQQDSQEFWKLLLPALKLPALMDLYQGCFEDYIKALDGSNREKLREEPFLDLSLDVTRNSVIEGLKASFGSPELLSEKEGNGWRPEKGANRVDALKGSLLRVQGLPSILQLHLKRFNYDWQTDTMSKINDRCSFPCELDLSNICEGIQDHEKPTAKYTLQSIVIHTGEYGAGHYYAYVRPNIHSDDWYRFNDHIVEEVSYSDVIADAYGGRNARSEDNGNNKRKGPGGLLRRLSSVFQQKDPFGYGGRTSNAYVVQYVRQCDIPTLYCQDDNPQ